jgi:hypothetical protein
MQLPGTSVERFEHLRRRLCGLRSTFRVNDVNLALQALERVAVGAEQILLEEANAVGRHRKPP